MKRLYIDIGSTYYKIFENGRSIQIKRDSSKSVRIDLLSRIKETFLKYKKKNIYVTSSANGGLNALIIGATHNFSVGFASNIATNSGVNVIKSILFDEGLDAKWSTYDFDVIIIVGGINGVSNKIGKKTIDIVNKIKCNSVVYAGSNFNIPYLDGNIKSVIFLKNILDNRLKSNNDELSGFLIKLYDSDIVGKSFIEDVKAVTSNSILPTPYVVNKSLQGLSLNHYIASPFLLIDIGGATTDIHFSTDLAIDRYSESGFDRLVFKKLGIFKSRKSLLFSAKNNEYMYELLQYLNITEDIYDVSNKLYVDSKLMQISLFLVLYRVSGLSDKYLQLQLDKINELVITGGAAIVLSVSDIQKVIDFFNTILLSIEFTPNIIIDTEYIIWTQGIDNLIEGGLYE
jgi:hypothetical protein